MSIAVKNISKRFGNFVALDDVSLDVPARLAAGAAGPLGLGQDHAAADHRRAGNGRRRLGAATKTKTSPAASARDRNVGFVFQHYALFRHMTVFENVAFGLRVRKAAKRRSRRARPRAAAPGAAGRPGAPLSRRSFRAASGSAWPWPGHGHSAQGAAAGRAVRSARRQGAAGAAGRGCARLHDEIHMTSVFVTHDQEEAFEVADTVVVMNHGRVEQVGTPQEVFEHPANPFVMDFLGNVNVFHGRVQNGRATLGPLERRLSRLSARRAARRHRLFSPARTRHRAHRNGVPAMAATVERINSAGPWPRSPGGRRIRAGIERRTEQRRYDGTGAEDGRSGVCFAAQDPGVHARICHLTVFKPVKLQ